MRRIAKILGASAALIVVGLIGLKLAVSAHVHRESRAVSQTGTDVGAFSGPEGSVNMACAAFVGDDRLVAAFEDAASGLYELWSFDVRSRVWRRERLSREKVPRAIGGDGNERIAVIAESGRSGERRTALKVFRGARMVHEAPFDGGFGRVLLPTPDPTTWLLGGVIKIEDRDWIACRVDVKGALTPLVPAPESAWLGASGSEFTGLIARGDRLLVSSTASCVVSEHEAATGKLLREVDLAAGDPDLALACRATDAPTRETYHDTEWPLSVDMPIRLVDAGPAWLAAIRRAGRSGWTILAFDDAGARIARVDLPWESGPRAGNARWLLTGRGDLDVPGQPDRLELHRMEDVLAGNVTVTPPPIASASIAIETIDPSSATDGLWNESLLVVDGSICPGTVAQVVTIAASDGRLARERYRLVVHDAPTSQQVTNLHRLVARHVALDSLCLDWKREDIPGGIELGPGVRVIDRSAWPPPVSR